MYRRNLVSVIGIETWFPQLDFSDRRLISWPHIYIINFNMYACEWQRLHYRYDGSRMKREIILHYIYLADALSKVTYNKCNQKYGYSKAQKVQESCKYINCIKYGDLLQFYFILFYFVLFYGPRCSLKMCRVSAVLRLIGELVPPL